MACRPLPPRSAPGPVGLAQPAGTAASPLACLQEQLAASFKGQQLPRLPASMYVALALLVCCSAAAAAAAAAASGLSLLRAFSSPAKKKLVLVKLGGSAITDKTRFETLQSWQLESIASDLAAASTASSSHAFVLVHGAGSFGHHDAKRFNLSTGGNAATWVQGFAITQRSVTKLSAMVLGALHAHAGLRNVISLPLFPSTVTQLSKKQIHRHGNLELKTVESLLDPGFLPLIHGTMAFDSEKRCAVLSGDKILSDLAKTITRKSRKYTIAATVFLTDVDGVYDANPSLHRGATLIREIRVGRDGKPKKLTALAAGNAHGAVDVTGGILAKLSAAFEIAAITGAPVFILRAGSPEARRALAGQPTLGGTRIQRE